MEAHITLDLHGEELGGQHQPRLAIPVRQPPVRRQGREGASRVLVETYSEAKIELAGLDRAVGAEHRRTASRAPVGDVDEGDAGQPQFRHHRVRIPRSEAHTSELQSLMRTTYAVFCLKKKNKNKKN